MKLSLRRFGVGGLVWGGFTVGPVSGRFSVGLTLGIGWDMVAFSHLDWLQIDLGSV